MMTQSHSLPQLNTAPLTNAVFSAFISAVNEMKPVLVLDLDNTIIYSTPLRVPQSQFTVRMKKYRYYIQVRPGFPDFFRKISELFEVFFFTAADETYANKIINKIAPNVDVSHRFFKNNCTQLSGILGKDLSILNRPLNKILLIDDVASSGALQPGNIIRITPWSGEEDDSCLIDELLPLLVSVSCAQDLPTACKFNISTHNYQHLHVN